MGESRGVAGHDELCFAPACELMELIRRRALSPVELVGAYLTRIAERNDLVRAYVTVTADAARAAAKRAERAVMRGGTLGPMHGLPIAIKDLEDKAGVRTTFGSRALLDYVPASSAIIVERLESAGAIVLGKTNVPEFGHKAVTDNRIFGATSTPFAIGMNAGGSSGGSAAAVADGLAAVAQGGDGGGSIRIPAALCGVYGIKPSWGRVPHAYRPDAFLFSPFVSHGPLARTVADAALMLETLSGPDSRDPLSLPSARKDYVIAAREGTLRGLRVAYSRDLDYFPVSRKVTLVVDAAVRTLEDVGAEVELVELGLPGAHGELANRWLRLNELQYASMLASWHPGGVDLMAERRDLLEPEVVARVERGRSISALEFKAADLMRTDVYLAIERVLSDFDMLVSPTLGIAGVANQPDGRTQGVDAIDGRRVNPLLDWALTHPMNFSGHPAASAPAGLTSDGLPVGLQIVGRRFGDRDVLAASAAFERVRPWEGLRDAATRIGEDPAAG